MTKKLNISERNEVEINAVGSKSNMK